MSPTAPRAAPRPPDPTAGLPATGSVAAAAGAAAPGSPAASRNVVALGATSLLTDLSSDMIFPLLPAFVTGTLRASATNLGVIEGIAECTSTALRVGSGWLSDRIGRRMPFILAGYGLSTAAKCAMAAAGSWPVVLGLRFSDRLGKGLRNPARDALIAESVARDRFGSAFGLHRAMDTVGAVLGPLAAFALLSLWPGEFRRVFLLAAIPAVLSLIVLVSFVRAPARPGTLGRPAARGGAGVLGAEAYRFIAVSAVFALGGSSLAFVLLRAGEVGFGTAQVPLVYGVYNLVYALLAWPLGRLSDRIGRRPLLVTAYLSFAACYALLAWQGTQPAVAAALVGLGVHSALLEGTARSMLADLVDEDRRGTAFGLYYGAVGVALLLASLIAGLLWDRFGPAAMFSLSAALGLVAALLFVLLLPVRRERSDPRAVLA